MEIYRDLLVLVWVLAKDLAHVWLLKGVQLLLEDFSFYGLTNFNYNETYI